MRIGSKAEVVESPQKGLRGNGAPDRIGSDLHQAILGSVTRRRYAPPPETLTRFVERGPSGRKDDAITRFRRAG